MAPTREAPFEILADIPINGENRARTFTSQESVNSYSFFKLGTSDPGVCACAPHKMLQAHIAVYKNFFIICSRLRLLFVRKFLYGGHNS